MYNYLDAVVNQEVSRVDGIKIDPELVYHIIRSLARCTASMATNEIIEKDLRRENHKRGSIDIENCINALKRIHVIDDLPAWNSTVRSKTRIRTHAPRHFCDPSIASAALRMDQHSLLTDFNTVGLLFESLCVRDLR
ncbi:MAG: DUF4143 domain-containing protein, partial [Christensenellaceae bacterium]|nr:DUF4143 domain-containing protein [Christensenellaceae bacterium]